MAEAAKNILSRVDFLQLIPHKCSLVTTLLPALQEVGLVRINETCSLAFPASVGDGSRSDPPLKSSLAYPQRPGNFTALHSVFLQVQDVFIPSHSLGSPRLLCLLDSLCLSRTPFFCTAQLGKRLGELHRDTGSQILDEMPAVAHLSRLWSAFANSRSIFRGAIESSHLNRGMLLQPGFDGRNLAVGEQINGLTALQITDQRAIAEAALVCPVVQTNDARRGLGGLLKAANQTQDGITTPTETLFLTSVSACLASHLQSKPTECLLQPLCALSHEDGRDLEVVP